MDIDWSKAPADAEAGYLGTSSCYDAWYRKDGAGQVQQICPAGGCNEWTWMGGRKDYPVGAVLRPSARIETEWTGEGLPPVGLKVEALLADNGSALPGNSDWCELTLKYRSTDFSIFERADGEEFPLWNPQYSKFRPIRTAEQIEKEEREVACRQLCIDAGSSDYTGRQMEVAYKLYDAGYRKQEQK